ncbi:hypothetical protein PHJA_002474100 [Phtheirospermum japonicum]|uniref:Uncharacterized protein n=1 Tax=Phtheirospermum japonicum TaxID=374723 RepID=A0A830CYG0_9LAMI|nr:hypothetical protein PHJA_002474100 [Phtheirospermum japonicum]
MQSLEVIMQIISEATIPPAGVYNLDMMEDLDSDPNLDVDSSGEVIYATCSRVLVSDQTEQRLPDAMR